MNNQQKQLITMQGFLGKFFSDVVQILEEGKFELPEYPPIRPDEEPVGEMTAAEKAIATINLRLLNNVPRPAESDSLNELKRKDAESYTALQRVRLLSGFLSLLIGERLLGKGDPKKHAGFAVREGGTIVLTPANEYHFIFVSRATGESSDGKPS